MINDNAFSNSLNYYMYIIIDSYHYITIYIIKNTFGNYKDKDV